MTMMKKSIVTGMACLMMAGTAFGAEENRKVGDFTAIDLKGSMDVHVVVGKTRSVRVVANDDIIEKLLTEVDGDTLVIKLKGRYSNVGKMDVYVTVKNLEEAYVKGSGDMDIKGSIKSKKFEAAVKGSGNLILENVKANDLELDIMGSGDMRVSGSCDDLDLDIMGSGDLKASKVKCETAKVAIMGSGDANIYASKSLNASIMGSGDINYYGKPAKLRRRVMGSGDINEK